jgi:hypothetical protein
MSEYIRFFISSKVNPAAPSPSVPSIRSVTMVRALRVRRSKSWSADWAPHRAPVSPKIWGYPVSGWSGLASQ